MPEYPRPLTQTEHELLFWILPPERNGYKLYRNAIQNFLVIGEGRRGNGELILGAQNDVPDFDEPLTPVFAYGAIETTFGTISITARDISHGQASVEIVNHRNERVPEEFEESRRWTYSTWKSGDVCPQCLQTVREVQMHSAVQRVTLAICRTDKRLWVFDFSSEVNKLIPITNFYNELMFHKNIRDPKIALNSKLFFERLMDYTDKDLLLAFHSYNKLKTKVFIHGNLQTETKETPGFLSKVKNIFSFK